MLKPYAWWIFLFIALILSVLCFGVHDDFPHTMWNHVHDKWLHKPPAQWLLNTTQNYTLKQKLYNGSKVVEYDFVVSEINTNIDGVDRKVIGINGKYPGPLIEAFEGDTIRVKVTNKMKNSRTLLHFHGLDMNSTNYFDGSPGITQCGVDYDHPFVYEFTASPAGTYWYHAHWDTQMVMGLVGPLVIHKPETKKTLGSAPRNQSFAKDQVILLTDLYNKNPHDIMSVFLEPWIGGTIEPIPDIALVQGVQSPQVELPAGQTSMLRIINAASYSAFRLELEFGKMQVIEADGVLTEPTTVESLLIYPAQRYSVLITLNETTRMFTTPQLSLYEVNDEETHFSTDNLERSSSDLFVELTVGNATTNDQREVDYTSKQLAFENLTEPYFRPLYNDHIPEAVLVKNVDLSMTRSAEGAVAGAINDKVFKFDYEESMLSFIFRAYTSYEQKKKEPKVKHHTHKDIMKYRVIDTDAVTINSTISPRRADIAHENPQLQSVSPLHISDEPEAVDFVIRNFDDGPHPMHLHGHKMWVLERGSLDTNARKVTTIYDRPLKRDVVWLPTEEWVRVRVKLDNPGLWYFHCHIPWHSRTGMATVVASQLDKINRQLPPMQWFELCSVSHEDYADIHSILAQNASSYYNNY